MNYMGERRDVLTLAHELGHAVHQTLCAPLGTLLADTPLTLAETASIFGEGLVFDRLLAEATPKDRMGLLAGKIEDGLNTVVRQIAFHRFERRFHEARKDGELSPDQIGRLWLEVMAESLGPAVVLNEGYEHYWAYVSHFVHAPFYVYAYAFGDLLVRGLMEKRREDPEAFAPLYEDLLAAGGTPDLCRGPQAVRPEPARKGVLGGGVRAAGTVGRRVRGVGVKSPQSWDGNENERDGSAHAEERRTPAATAGILGPSPCGGGGATRRRGVIPPRPAPPPSASPTPPPQGEDLDGRRSLSFQRPRAQPPGRSRVAFRQGRGGPVRRGRVVRRQQPVRRRRRRRAQRQGVEGGPGRARRSR